MSNDVQSDKEVHRFGALRSISLLDFCFGGDDELLLTRLEHVSEETESHDFLMTTAFLVPQILATNIAVHDTTWLFISTMGANILMLEH